VASPTRSGWASSTREASRGRDAALLCRTFRDGRDQQHFLRMPAETMLAHWAEEVPESFSLRSRRRGASPTSLRLKECGTHVGEFFRRAQALGREAWAVLSSCRLPEEGLPRLRDFSRCCRGRPAASEFRNESGRTGGLRGAASQGRDAVFTDTEERRLAAHRRDRGSGYLRLRRTHYEDRAARRLGRAHRGARLRARLRLLHARGRRAGHGVRPQADGTMETAETPK